MNNSYQLNQKSVNLKKYTKYFIFIVALLGILVLLGWGFDIEGVKRPIPHLVAMNPLTAFFFILLAFISWSILIKNWNSVFGYSLLIILLVISTLHLSEFIFHIPLNIDQLLFNEKLEQDALSNISNRMAPNTAVNFMLAGCIIWLIHLKVRSTIIQCLTIIIIFIALFSVLGYMYQVTEFYGILVYLPMALHTAFGFLLFAIAILLFSSDSGIVKEITSPYTGGTIARVLIPISIIVPSILGYLWILAYWKLQFSVELGVAILTIAIISLFVFLIWIMISSLNQKDKLRKSSEIEILSLNKELEAFSYSVAHDLRAPLRIIDGYAQILTEDQTPNLNVESRRLLSIITLNVRNMGILIDDLLNFSKLGRVQINRSWIDVSKIITPIINEQLSNPENSHLSINVKSLEKLRCDSALMYNVFFNLIINAVKYSKLTMNPIIEIGSYREKGATVYYVKDNGVGFDMKYKHKLFGVFQRLHKASEFEGTGVGLAIVHRVITRHGGIVWAEAEVGKGAIFYFKLYD